MANASQTNPGTKKLSEVAKRLVRPSGITSTGWPAVEHTCSSKLGIEFDEWQKGAGRLILSKRSDGKLAAMVGGVCMSFPRQVGKTYLLAGLIFGLCVDNPGLLVIWSAHHSKTHGETFLAMQAFAERLKVAPYIDRVYTGSGDEEVRFANGSRILFGARESGFGRGIPGVDILVMDEAQILSDKALENMLATLNTSQFGLQLYVGTPPKPEDNSEAFCRMRAEALECIETSDSVSEDLVWIECGADDDAQPDDSTQYAKANPSFPHRTPIESILRLRKKLTRAGFLREAMGIWDSKILVVFDMSLWDRLIDRDADQPERVALVVDVSPDRSWSCIGVAGKSESRDDTTLVLCHSAPGTDWVAGKVAELVKTRDVAEVGIVMTGQAKSIQAELVKEGIEFVKLTSQDMGSACGAFQEAVKSRKVSHVGQAELDKALDNAKTRYMGETQLWDRRDQEIDISPLVACSAAYYRWSLLPPGYDVTESIW